MVASGTGQPQVIHIIAHALYNALKVVFGIFGLKPVYALYLLAGLFVLGVATQIRAAIKGRSAWTFDPLQTPKKGSE